MPSLIRSLTALVLALFLPIASLLLYVHAVADEPQPGYVIDHAQRIANLDDDALARGRQIYENSCITCHGDTDTQGTLPTATVFHENPLNNGSDPHSMYRTLADGFGMMIAQPWLTPQQKYDVIHYVRQTQIREHNPDQFFEVTDEYLNDLEPETLAEEPREQQPDPYRAMDYGPTMKYTLQVEHDNIAYKGIAVRLDPGPGGIARGNAWILYDHDTLRVAALWTGDEFIDYRSIGMDGSHHTHPSIVGDVHMTNPVGPGWAQPGSATFDDPRMTGRDDRHYGPLPRDWAHYRGLYHHNQRAILSYTVGNTAILESPSLQHTDDGQPVFTRTLNLNRVRQPLLMRVAPADDLAVALLGPDTASLSTNDGHTLLHIEPSDEPQQIKLLLAPVDQSTLDDHADQADPPADLHPLTTGGPQRWQGTVTTEPRIADNDAAYVVDEFTPPFDNPWDSWLRLSAFDFFDDGQRAAVATWHGDVWIVEDIAANPDQLHWTRIATGLFQPLGLKIIDEQIYLTCRDQLVILHDLNGNGEIDFYENFNNNHQVTEHFHEFAMGLERDELGNFYYTKAARHAADALVPHHGTLLRVSPDGSETQVIATGFRAPNGVKVIDSRNFYLTDQEGHWVPKNRIDLVTPGNFYGYMDGYHDIDDPSDDAMQQPVMWLTNHFNRSPAELTRATSDQWGPLSNQLIELSYGMGRIHMNLIEEVDGQLQGGQYALPIPDFDTGVMRGRMHLHNGQLYALGMFAWAGNATAPGGFYRVRYTGNNASLPIDMHAHQWGMRLIFTEPLDPDSATSPDNITIRRWQLNRTADYGSPHVDEHDVPIDAIELSDDHLTLDLHIDNQPTQGMSIEMNINSAAGQPVPSPIHNTIHNLRP